MKQRGIPTRYNGIQFRSLLEARWAAFFDLAGWRYVYEPREFAGWIPDFSLSGKQFHVAEPDVALPGRLVDTAVYVEIKPVADFPWEIADDIDASGCADECLILGLSPTADVECFPQFRRVGWLRETTGAKEECWDEAMLLGDIRPLGFCHAQMSYHDRISGQHKGDNIVPCPRSQVEELWRRAGNTVQWNAPREVRR